MIRMMTILRAQTASNRELICGKRLVPPVAMWAYNLGGESAIVNIEGGDSYSEKGEGHDQIGYVGPLALEPGGVRATVLDVVPQWLSLYLDQPVGEGVRVILACLDEKEVE